MNEALDRFALTSTLTMLLVASSMTAATIATPGQSGACCLFDSCADTADEAACDALGGVFLSGEICADDPCGEGACCFDLACGTSGAFACVTSGRTFAGAGTSCLDDPCEAGVGACCLDELCEDRSPERCDASGGMWLGAGTSCATEPCTRGACCLDEVCTDTIRLECLGKDFVFFEGALCEDDPCSGPDFCPEDTLFSQSRDMPDDFLAATSDAASPFERWEDFEGLTGAVDAVTWWGLDLELEDGVFIECDETDPTFTIAFHKNAGGVPGDVVCSWTLLATRTPTGVEYLGAELNEYHVELPETCALVNGWISIVGRGDPTCWFLWMSAGLGSSYCSGCAAPEEGVDLAVCLQGEEGGVFGACCIDATATCTDDVEIIDCAQPGQRFVPGARCEDLQPPCGVILGACCYADATCVVLEQADCVATTGNWLGADTPCSLCPCITPCPPGGVAEGEPACFDGTIDTFNGGCTSALHLFSPIVPGETVCGRSGLFDLDGETTPDYDWYELNFERSTPIVVTVTAEFRPGVFIVDGSEGCPGRTVIGVGALECETIVLDTFAGPGTTWIAIAPVAFTDSSFCGTRYTLDVHLISSCPLDFDDDGIVGFTDLLSILASWGPCGGCPQDVDDSGDVGFTDLLSLLAAWGACI